MVLLLISPYYIFITAGESLGDNGKLPVFLAVWTPNILLGDRRSVSAADSGGAPMKILDRYISREFFKVFLFGIIALILVSTAVNIFETVDEIVEYKPS